MKHISVRNQKGLSGIYTSATVSSINEQGELKNISQTEDEMDQQCYNSLIDAVKRKEFEKNLISILSNYDERMLVDWTNIHIKISYSVDREYEMNITNSDVLLLHGKNK